MDRFYTTPIHKLTSSDFTQLVRLALEEDMPEKDITSESIFSKEQKANDPAGQNSTEIRETP